MTVEWPKHVATGRTIRYKKNDYIRQYFHNPDYTRTGRRTLPAELDILTDVFFTIFAVVPINRMVPLNRPQPLPFHSLPIVQCLTANTTSQLLAPTAQYTDLYTTVE
jgi:hypothetical protein